MSAIALVDCNNFYASCERLFQPRLHGRPLVVLSNNDGCVISRSDEAKRLGVRMGMPAFQLPDIPGFRTLEVFSSNYALYGDISARVMEVLRAEAPSSEVYSIDECFLGLEAVPPAERERWCRALRDQVLRWVGMPVSIGLGPTKTLAKLANRLAKKTPEAGDVLMLETPSTIAAGLAATDIQTVWGIGRRWAGRLSAQGIATALALRDAPDGWVRRQMGVTGLRTVHELRGLPCHDLETQPQPRQTRRHSRTFGVAITDKAALREAVAAFAGKAAAAIRGDGQRAGALQLYITTDRHRRDQPQRTVSAARALPAATDDSRVIVAAALGLLDGLWQPGYAWRKAGVELFDLAAAEALPASLFDPPEPANGKRLMAAIDTLNRQFGRGTVQLGQTRDRRLWHMRQARLSPRFTTSWSDLPVARA